MRKSIFLILIVFALFSCKKEEQWDCFKGTGKVTSEVRNIESFESIILNDNINLFICQDTCYSCKVEAGENLLPKIKTEVNNNILEISNKNTFNWVRSFKTPINVFLTFPKLYYVEYNGSGNIECEDTLSLDSIRVDSWDGSGSIHMMVNTKISRFNLHTGPADLNVSGSSGVNYVYSAGNGKADLSGLYSGYIFITSKSTNETYVNVSKELEAWIDYVGNIYYKGNPYSVKKKYTGSGRLFQY